MNRDTIIAIVGKSGSGKSTIAQYFHDRGINVLQSYTDRAPRSKEEWGHIFINTETAMQYATSDKSLNANKPVPSNKLAEDIIAYTYFDKHHYFAKKQQYKNHGITLYIIDPDGIKTLKRRVTDADIITVYINAEEIIRYNRMLDRFIDANKNKTKDKEDLTDKAKNSAYERIVNDEKKFSIIECDFVIDNNGSLEDVIDKFNKILDLNSIAA